MTEEAANPNGESLQEALHRLDQLNLPGDALPALRQAQEALSNLLERFPSQEESRLAALYRLSQALGSSLDVEEVIRQVMDAVIYLTQAERGFLVLLEDGNQDWQVRAARNWSQEDLAPDELEFSRTVIRSVLEQGTGVVTTDAQKDPRFARQESVHIYSLRSILCAPLHSRGRVTGVIYVDNRIQSGLFTPADLEMLTAFGAQAAVAIENAHLYTQTDRALAQRVTELETLSKIDQELNAQLDLDRTLGRGRQSCRESQGSAPSGRDKPG
jgi:GAF domain-containing protein